MIKSVFALAAAAALVSGLAMAGEVKQVQKPVVTAPTQMSDADMDKVTAGAAVSPTRDGVFTAQAAGGQGFVFGAPNVPNPNGAGVLTADAHH